MGLVLLIVLVLLLLGGLPNWGHSRNWGYRPSGGLGMVLLVVVVLILLGVYPPRVPGHHGFCDRAAPPTAESRELSTEHS